MKYEDIRVDGDEFFTHRLEKEPHVVHMTLGGKWSVLVNKHPDGYTEVSILMLTGEPGELHAED